MGDFKRYIGRDYEKYNCFDLAKEFYSVELGLVLQNYFEGEIVPDRKTIECLVKTSVGDFEQVLMPKFGDIVVINLFGYDSHIGVCLGNGYFLHSVRKIGSCMDSLGGKYARMIRGYYRHRERV